MQQTNHIQQKQILHIIDHLRGDGTQRFLCNLVKKLHQRGYKQHVVSLRKSVDPTITVELEKFAAVTQIGVPSLLLGIGYLQLYYLMCRLRVSTVISFLFVSEAVGIPIARIAGVPNKVSAIRARNINYSLLQRNLSRTALRFADRVALVSESLTDFVLKNYGVSQDKIAITPNGVELDCSNVLTRDELIHRFELDSNRHIFFSAGRLEHQKGFDLALDAFAKLHDSKFSWLIAGCGSQHAALSSKIKSLGLADKVKLIGYIPNVCNLIGAADCFLLPSRFEGSSQALLEALYLGVPAIASAVDGNNAIIAADMSERSQLFDPCEPNGLSTCLLNVLNMPLNELGRQRLPENSILTLDQMADAWEAIIV